MGISGGTGGGKLVTKSGTAGQTTLAATGVGTNSNTTPGSYVQATGSTAAEYLLTGIDVRGTSNLNSGLALQDFPILIDVATGGAGSETVMATVPLSAVCYTGASDVLADSANLAVPLRIPAGTRIAVRATKFGTASGASSATSIVVTLILVPYINIEGN